MIPDDYTDLIHERLALLRSEAAIDRVLRERPRRSWRRTLALALVRLAVRFEPDVTQTIRTT